MDLVDKKYNHYYHHIVYYYYNNPNPIVFGIKNISLSSTDLNTYLESKLVKDLFSTSEVQALRLLLFISLGLSIIVLLILLFYNPSPPVTLADNEVNRMIIDGVVREIFGR
jgi:hypothetical protein